MLESEFQTEEFKQLKAELASRETAMGTLLTVGLVSCVTLLSALISVAIHNPQGQALPWEFAFTFLSPFFILFPMLWLVLDHRLEVHKIGSYLQAFYDERSLGTKWEVRVEVFRHHFERSHTLDAVPILAWSIFILCSIAFLYGCHQLGGATVVVSAILLLPIIILVRFHFKWNQCANEKRKEYLALWRLIRDNEKPNHPLKK
jgi:hypothetical protein